MNKKRTISMSLIVLISVLFIASSITTVQAAPGDQGVDVITEGSIYYFETVSSDSSRTRRYWGGSETLESTSSDTSRSAHSLNITEVNATEGRIRYRIRTNAISGIATAYNTTKWGYALIYDDDDNDNLMESFTFLADSWSIIAGSWENWTENIEDLQQDLEDAKADVSSFDYSLNVNANGQKVSLTLEYQMEDIFSSGTLGSVIYDMKETYSMDYNNFVLSSREATEQKSLNTIVNQEYIEDENEIITISSSSRTYTGPTTSEGGGIPGYELYALLTISAVSIIGVAIIFKRKRMSI
ncbi:MAG: hypothetical protein JW891_17550 [Candidatus Lokiarchaeota archaeon]|nr:hypothetical protein [Candidatus Lokiarchaeota archaeon]